MATRVFLTVDTELAWRHHAAGLPAEEIVTRSIDPAGVGLAYQLARFEEHRLRACFFVDPMPALLYGLEPFKRIVGAVLDAGQEVQLHLHPGWIRASLDDRAAHGRYRLADYSAGDQLELIDAAAELIRASGAPRPIAFRAGCYAANDATLEGLAELGFVYDSSHNGTEQASAIGLSRRQVAPIGYRGIVEVPVSLIEDKRDGLRHFQICALSTAEIVAALNHAVRERHVAVTIVSHSFELATRSGKRRNMVHVGRFDALVRMLASVPDALVTSHFGDRPVLPLGRANAPLGPSVIRAGVRHAQQLWSNVVEERSA